MPTADGIPYGAGYFAGTYRDYERQNPRRKVEWYLRQAHKWLPPTPARHLDLGCGLGAMLAASTRRGNHATGTDISPYAVSEASGRVSSATVLVAPATKQPFSDATFDLISVLDVLEHLDEPGRALVEVRRLLSDHGVALLVVPVYDGLSGPLIRKLDRDPTHLHRLARSEWLSIVGEVLEVQEWVGMFRLLPPLGPYLHWPTAAMRHHTPAIAVIARRGDSN